ncbi:MAG: tetratricopeptide repeat protein [Bacteroidales bacterium]
MKKSFLIILLGIMGCVATVGAKTHSSLELMSVPDGKKYGEDSVNCVKNLSLYRESFKQWKASKYKNEAYKDALKPWRWVMKNCPSSSQYIYIDGPKMIDALAKKEKDQAVKEKYLDTLEMLYDLRIQYFPLNRKKQSQKGAILGRKGVDIITSAPKRFEKAYNTLKESVEIEGDKSSASVLVYYMYSTVRMVKAGKLEKAAVIDVYDVCSTYLSEDISHYKKAGKKKNADAYQSYLNNVEKYFEPYANCEDLISIYQEKFAKNPNDLDLLKRITNILTKKKCEDSELFFSASENLYKLEPSPNAAFNIGIMLLKKKENTKGIEYLKEAEKTEDSAQLEKVYLLLADAYKAVGQYSIGRDYARKLLKLDPNNGNAYLIIGQMYAASSKSCGSDELGQGAVFCAAVDQFARARQVSDDPKIDAAANKLIATYSKYFPNSEVIFFNSLKEGDSYEIGCWMNVTTKLRAAK